MYVLITLQQWEYSNSNLWLFLHTILFNLYKMSPECYLLLAISFTVACKAMCENHTSSTWNTHIVTAGRKHKGEERRKDESNEHEAQHDITCWHRLTTGVRECMNTVTLQPLVKFVLPWGQVKTVHRNKQPLQNVFQNEWHLCKSKQSCDVFHEYTEQNTLD
jgi:hypothetical protein